MYTINDINETVTNYLGTEQGHQILVQNGYGYSITEMTHIAEMLYNEIIDAYLALVHDSGKYFARDKIKVSIPTFIEGQGYKLKITFPKNALFRQSLHRSDGKGFTGQGVYDIIGLFSNSFSGAKQVFGWWWDNADGTGERDIYTASKTSRVGNPFVKEIVKKYEAEYPMLQIEYPKLWGGMSNN